MSKSVSLTESVSTYVLAQLFKSYTQQQQLDFMEQVLNAEPNAISDLIVYMKDKELYYHPEHKVKLNEYILINTNFSWNTSSELSYYVKNNLIRDGYIMVKLIKFNILNNSHIVVRLRNNSGFEDKNILTSYVKKIDLF